MSRRPALTRKRLRAMEAALVAMLAGPDNEGDWPENVARKDLTEALDAVRALLPTETP